MIDYTYKDLYYQDSVDKQLKIEVEDGAVITNEDIFSESMTLTESLCSDTNLSFGSCEASKFEIKIANQFYSMKGMWLSVSEVLNGHENEPFVFGKYKVESDRPTADRSFREIVAYDALYDIINADVTDVAEWYETLLPELDSTVTLKEFRDSFFAHFDIEQEEVELPNDDMIVEKTITAASLSGKEVVTAICEINGCFGHIGRDNKFHYIFLPEISDGNAYALAVDDDTFLVTPSRNASTSAILGHAVLGDAILGDDSVPSKTAVLGYATLGRAVLANEDEPPEVQEFGIGISHTEGAKQATVIEKENWQAIDYEDYVTETISSLQLRDNTSEAGYTYDFGVGGNNYIIDGNFLIYGKDDEETHEIAKNIYDKISCVSYRPTDATLRGNPCFEVGDPIQLNSKYQVINTYIIKRTLSGIQALKDNYESTGDETYDNAYNSISYEVEQLRGISNTFERSLEQNTLEIKNLEGQVSTIDQTINSISFNVTGGLGGTAYITMKVGDESIEADIDLSDVREAFANEKSSIEIAAGVITFAANTLIVDSDNFKLSAGGKINATNADIEGDIVATSLSAKDTIYIYDDSGYKMDALSSYATSTIQSRDLYVGRGANYIYLSPAATTIIDSDLSVYGSGNFQGSLGTQSFLSVYGDAAIAGNLTVDGTSGTNHVKISGCNIEAISNSSSGYIYLDNTYADFGLRFTDSEIGIYNNSDKMWIIRLLYSGGIHIGSGDTAYSLYATNARGQNRIVVTTNNTATQYVHYIYSTYDSDSNEYGITINGCYGTSNGTSSHSFVIAASDARLKDEIKDTKVENALDQILSIRHREFVWKESRDFKDIGYIAQEMEEINPFFVIRPNADEENSYYSINTFYLEVIITKSIQEIYNNHISKNEEDISILKEQIRELEEEIQTLKGVA